MNRIWSTEEEAQNLTTLFAAVANKAAFARQHNVPGGASMLSQHLSGNRPISMEAAVAYANGLGVAIDKISPRIAKQLMDFSKLISNVEPTSDTHAGKVPLISWVQAGAWCEAADPFLVGEAEMWLDCPVFHSEYTYALRVRGDSMTAPSGSQRSYPDGCIVYVDPMKRDAVNGDRIIACLLDTHDVTFKVYKNEDGRQWLMPLNPLHEPIRDPFRVLGKIIGKWEDG
ncbi:MAG: S24 family peptidase [Comamonas sp.]